MMRWLAALAISCGIFHGERVADRPRAPIDAELAIGPPPNPPPPPPEIRFVEPAVLRATLSNGVRVAYLVRGDLPITNMTIAFARGAADSRAGAAAVFLRELESGRELDDLGAESTSFVARDAAGLEIASLGARTPLVLGALKAIFSRRTNAEDARRSVAARVQAEWARPESLANAAALQGRPRPSVCSPKAPGTRPPEAARIASYTRSC